MRGPSSGHRSPAAATAVPSISRDGRDRDRHRCDPGRCDRDRHRRRRRRDRRQPAVLGAEVAELLADLAVEGVLERDVLAVGAVGLGAHRRRRGARGRSRPPRSDEPLEPPPDPSPPRGVTGESETLPLRVDVVDVDLDLVAEVEHVLDLVDALAATDLGDVQQAVAAREDVDERTELGDVDDPAGVDLAPTSAVGGLRMRRIWRSASATAPPSVEPMDTMPTMPSSSTLMSAPVSCWMALMTLPFGPMTSPILSIGISKLMIFGACSPTSSRGSAMAPAMTSRICEAGVLGLVQGAGQHVGGDAVDLGVELQRGDELGRAGDLEVHVAERVLGTEDVGEGGVLALGEHEAHGDAGDGGLDRHTGVHQRQGRAADRRHRGGAVGRQHVGDDAQRVGELGLGGQHRHEGPLGEHAVADLAALRAAHEAGLAGGERREVVVVHVALAVVDAEGVEHLLHAGHAERGDVEHLGLAALEQAGAVHRAGGRRPRRTAAAGRSGHDRRCGRRR